MSGDPIKAFGLVIRELRKAQRLSQEALSAEASMDRSFLSELETGRKQPSLLTIFSLATALQMDASELLRLVEARLAPERQD